MEYTSYGFWEGIVMLLPVISIISIVYIYKLIRHKHYFKGLTIVYLTILICLGLDTLMWVFSIETNIIDFYVSTSQGNIEQITIFGIAVYAYLFYLIRIGVNDKKEEQNKKEKGKKEVTDE